MKRYALLAVLAGVAIFGALTAIRAEDKVEKLLVINMTAGKEDLHSVWMGLQLAEHALDAGREATVFLNVKGAALASKKLEDLRFGEKPTVKEQMSRVAQAAPDIVSEPPASEARPDPASQKLTIGPGIHLKGQISNCDTLLVEGDIEASAVTRSIEISACGTFSGDAEIERADISGQFDGELTVADHLTIRSTGRVSGKIRYNSIEIEAGGQIAGDIQVSQTANAESAPDRVEDATEETEVEDQVAEKPAARTA